MSPILNLGVLAHVDAGKTSLTERLLFESGAITALGTVDSGTTRTDTLALEQQRGITIRAAVASTAWNDVQINLIDTPGHPDFIAEVERSLSVLDAVVLVISAVEGVQPQTRRLARAIRSLGLPCVIFCNKIDRTGAREDSLLAEIHAKLGWSLLPLSITDGIGTREATSTPRDPMDERVIEALAEVDDAIMTAWLEDEPLTLNRIDAAQRNAVFNGDITPVIFGSAMTGAGTHQLLDVLTKTLVPATPDATDLSVQAFKVEHDTRGERQVWLRIWSGTLHSRSEISVQRSSWLEPVPVGKITRLQRSTSQGLELVNEASAGDIVLAHGIAGMQLGDVIGRVHRESPRLFLPVFETVVREQQAEDRHKLRMALTDLADQDPFISLRLDPRTSTTSVRLFGEVQKEVIESNLLHDFVLQAIFEDSTVICMERPLGAGDALDRMGGPGNPFAAGIGLNVKRAVDGSGVTYSRSQQSIGRLPLAMYIGIEEMVRSTLAEGLNGWEVIDIEIELTFVEYADPVTIVSDFRNLAPLVLMDALKQAGTEVCEPIQRFRLSVPDDLLAEAIRLLVTQRGVIEESMIEGMSAVITGTIPAAMVPGFERQLPGISRGEGDLDHWHDSWRPVSGDPPVRPRTDHNPLNRTEYLSRVAGRM
ncbi:MAG: TetM/TetW/TetO/TetS family tetracycline resistance ribosomal protection protein [Thermomicrobiales bacterium]|nr:TetM/TetW/TetO/TetS family tetracycline resistance ribosomal protection protein [Thermomicrobiales bacterium]